MRLTILAAFLVLSQYAAAQDKVTAQYASKVKYQKTEQEATIMELPYPPSEVEEGLKGYFSRMGAKPRERNGFYEVKNVRVERLGNKVHDLYYRVDRDGKTKSKVSVIVADPGEDITTRSSSGAAGAVVAGGAVAAGMGAALGDHNTDVNIKKQEEEIKKTEKKLSSLTDEQARLEKKRADIEKEIERNKQDQVSAQNELDAKKQALAQFLEKVGKTKKN